MSEGRYRAAIIGCGRIASTIEDELRALPGLQPLPYSHAGAYRAAERVDLVAAADPDPGRRADLGRRWDVGELFADAVEMLDAIRPDIVSVCTPTRSHVELAIAAVRRGVRGVVLEKPVSVTLEEADRLNETAVRAGAVVAVNHTRTYDPLHERARELIRDGFIGTPDTVFVSWGEGWSFGGSHLFDLLRGFLDSDPVRVFCVGEGRESGDPGGDAYLEYSAGTRVFVRAPREPVVPLEVDVVGTGGRLRIGTFSLQLLRNDTSTGVPVPVEWPFFGRLEMRSAMTVLVEETIRAMEGGPPVRSGVVEGRKALEIAIALNESARLGAPVALPVEDVTLGVRAA